MVVLLINVIYSVYTSFTISLENLDSIESLSTDKTDIIPTYLNICFFTGVFHYTVINIDLM